MKGIVGSIILKSGDTLMLLSSDEWYQGEDYANDFHYIRHNEPIRVSSPFKRSFVFSALVIMMVLTFLGTPIVVSAMANVFALLFFKIVSLREAKEGISWGVLVMIASAFSLAKAIEQTGIAVVLAKNILLFVGTNPHFLIGALFLLSLIFTECITNTAAVMLLFPIALKVISLAGLYSPESLKAIGITVALGSSCSFITPIGYQTNTIVYGPGGYHFLDYFKVGLPLSVLIFALAVILIPYFWPLTQGN